MYSPHTQSNLTVVMIDDNEDHLLLMSNAIQKAFASEATQAATLGFENPADGLAEITDVPNQVILIDYQLSGSTGIDWLVDYVKADVGPVILVTSSGDQSIAADAFRAGASDYIIKSEAFKSPMILNRSIKEALRKYRLEHTNQDLAKRLKLANKELNSKNRKLTELTETAHRFVEDVAHEFRTPLTVIKEFASIIADGLGGEVTDKQIQYLNYITGSAGDLAGLIDDFLNSSRLRSNSICVARKEHSVGSVIDCVWPMLQSRAASKSIMLERKIEDDLPGIYVDSDKMQRSLINLVVNAIKFSENNGTVRLEAKRNDEHSVRIEVHDRGSGLPKESVDELFDRFNQGVSSSHHLANGFGLGLNIVKELVAINLGAVDIQSTLGEGSCFSFTVPISVNHSILLGLLAQGTRRSGSPRVVVLTAHRLRHDQPIEQLAQDLNAMSYPMDVVLQPSDSQDVFLIGITSDPEAFRNRIIQKDAEHQSMIQSPHSSLVAHISGVWPVNRAEKPVLDLIEVASMKEVNRA